MINAVAWVMWFIYCLVVTGTGILNAESVLDIMAQIFVFFVMGVLLPAVLVR